MCVIRVAAFQKVIDAMTEKYNLKNTFPYVDNIIVTGIDQKHYDNNYNLSALLKADKVKGFTFNETKE